MNIKQFGRMPTMIDYQLLIAAPMLQDLLVDKLGVPLAAGIVRVCSDPAFSVLKEWYYQTPSITSSTGYDYIALPNPMTLSAAGTIVDDNGNDTIPFWYPYDVSNDNKFQPYFIEVSNSSSQVQFTRINFPYVANQSPTPIPTNTNPTWMNYITNNRFWRNVGSFTPSVSPATSNMLAWTTQYSTSGTVYAQTLAPSQHDGFSMPDINFIKNNQSATETITFVPFDQTSTPILSGDITPEYYIQHHCTSVGSSETLKVYQFPISLHLQTLTDVNFSAKIQAISLDGSSTNAIQLYVYQFCGTNAASPVPVLIGNQTITLTTSWSSTIIPFTFPSTEGLSLSTTGDDAFYLQVMMPLNALCDVGFTLPSIYLSETVPSNDFATYDQIDAVINSPRTGDIRSSLNSFYPFGWVPMNNGTIGDAASNATARANADTWPLFYMLWTSFNAYGTAALPIYTSAGSGSSYGASAYVDFIANKALALTYSMGQVLMGTVPFSALLASTASIAGYTTTFTTTNSASTIMLFTATQNLNYFNGMPIQFTTSGASVLPNPLTANTVYYVTGFSGTNAFYVASSFANAMAANGGSTAVIAANTVIWGDNGTPGSPNKNTVSVAPAGTYEGEYAHTQLEAELATHSHPGSTAPMHTLLNALTGGGQAFKDNTSTTALTIAADGSSTPFNVTQPSVLTNIYIKL